MLELREQQTRTVELLAEEAAELSSWVRGTPGDVDGPRVIERLTPTDRPGWYHLQPGPYVGRFTLASGLTVDIASRLPLAALLEILRVATRKPKPLSESPAPAMGGHGLVDLIAAAFAPRTGAPHRRRHRQGLPDPPLQPATLPRSAGRDVAPRPPPRPTRPADHPRATAHRRHPRQPGARRRPLHATRPALPGRDTTRCGYAP
jgi:hypothetical protein